MVARNSRRRWLDPRLRAAIQLVVTVAVTWLIVDRLGVELDEALALRSAAPDLQPLVLGASVVLLLAGFTVSAILWGRMVRELGGPSPSLLVANRIVFTSNLARYLPGKVWQIAGLAVLARRAGIPATVGTAAAVLGQTFSLAAAGVLAVPALLGIDGGQRAWGGVVLSVLAVAVGLTSVSPVFRRLLRALFRLARLPEERVPRTGLWFGPRWVVAYVGNWILYSLAFVLFVYGLGWSAPAPMLASAFAAAYLMGYVAFFAPAGIGVREGFLIALLRPSIGGAAVAVALLARVWMTAVELLPAGVFGWWEALRSEGPDVGDQVSSAESGISRGDG